ncbi:hypothetical protein DM992_37800 [Burkholderia sp. JP2-270]|uniref:hypothetical protein n=1 Tax=Burkholderia sp. JP2-270 TaxID=2217913 RepID=UPI000DA32A60|nr:hypothetical protein [Burkholderia sp. JP2-270]AWV05022.1 hypothetical protein DM992_37800 [Burkholderia sp. JP2-270]
MNAGSNVRQTKGTASADERGGSGQRTVTPTRTRARAAKHGETRRSEDRDAKGSVTAGHGDNAGAPQWEDDGGTLPPDEWS